MHGFPPVFPKLNYPKVGPDPNPKALRSNFLVLMFSTVVGDLISPIFALFLPLFAYELGANAFELGLVGGVSYATYSFIPFVIGRYSDRMKRRRDLMVASLVLLSACSFVYAFVVSPYQLIFIRVLEGVGWAVLWPIIDVEVSEDVATESHKAFSIYNTIWSAATAIGPLLGVALILLLTQVRYIFIVTAMMMVLATAVNAAAMRDKKVAVAGPVSAPEEAEIPVRTRREEDPDSIWIFVAAMVLVSAIRGVLFTFYPALAESGDISYLVVGVVGSSFGSVRAVIFAFTTRDGFRGFFLKRENIRKTLLVSLAVSAAAACLPILGGGTLVVGLVSFSIVALASSFTLMISQAELISRAESHRRGSGAGIFETTIGVGVAIGPVAAGVISGGSLTTPFLIAPAGFILTLPVLLLLFRRHNDREQRLHSPGATAL
jgi:MFS family permease